MINKTKHKIEKIIEKSSKLHKIIGTFLLLSEKLSFKGSKEYWEREYASGGSSGLGSYGRYATFKAEIVGSFIKNNKISSVVEFGCGDGNQLSLGSYLNYIGLDVSTTAIDLCEKRFKADHTKRFSLYDPEHFGEDSQIYKAELALSLDVIYHLVEDKIFELYMKHLFLAADRFVIIYSTCNDVNRLIQVPHIKHRDFSKWVETNMPQWKLIKRIRNRVTTEQSADFFIYMKNE